MATKRESWREWERRVEAWRRSGDTALAFAERHGWNAKTLVWWSSIGLRNKRRDEQKSTFVEVVARPVMPARPDRVEILLGNGRRLRVAQGIDVGSLRALLAALEA